MHILVINSGSSSIKFSMFAGNGDLTSLYEGEVSGIGSAQSQFSFTDASGKDLGDARQTVQASSPVEAIAILVKAVTGADLPIVETVGYRVVHPGAKLKAHTIIDDSVLHELEKAAEFAPLHDPEAVVIISEMIKQFPTVPHYACFDTVFHETMPETATTYPLPADIRARGVRRYGFHGLSCESIVTQMREAAERGDIKFPQRMVIAHLGSGCSVTAIVDGKSIDTTMGLTPTGGVVMGTRPGDLDPGVMLYLLRQPGATVDSVELMVNHAAGMTALSGLPNDMKTVREAVAKGNAQAKLATQIFTRSIRKAIGSFCWLMGGVDAIVFAGGIGEHDSATRDEVLSGLQQLGVELDVWLDGKGDGVRLLSESSSQVAVYVVPADEDRMIATHVMNMAAL